MNTQAIEQAEVALMEAISGAICDAAAELLNAGLSHSQAERALTEALAPVEITDSIRGCVWAVNRK
jgi:hypothetical protein